MLINLQRTRDRVSNGEEDIERVEHEILIEAVHMNKTFISTKAVVDMHLEIRRGEIRGLIGENGCGKSTLSSMIAGSLKPDSGEMKLLGKPYSPKSAVEGQNLGIAMMVQEAGTINGLTVAENIFLGNHGEVSQGAFVSKKLMVQKSREVLDLIGATDVDPEKMIDEYSFEDRKLIEIAKALHGNPQLLILDETTTALSQRGRDIIYELIKKMKREDKAVLFISHDLEELKQVCDSVTIMRDGVYMDTLYGEDIRLDDMRRLMVGRDLSGHYYREDTHADYLDDVVLRVENVCLDSKLKDISLQLHRGEILGIGGLTDCGMHDLCKVIYGLTKPDSGCVRLGEREIHHEYDALEAGMGYIPKDREREGLVLTSSIRDNIMLDSYNKVKKGIVITRGSEKKLVNEQVEKLHIKLASINQAVVYLSGGNKQKVVIGKWTANDAQVILMDCPTRGIDIGAKAAIYELMESFKKEGRSMIMISEELPELIGMSDRIIIMKDGEISGEFMREDGLDEQKLIGYMI